MGDYFLKIIDSQEFEKSFEEIRKLENDLSCLKKTLKNASNNNKKSLKNQQREKEIKLEEKNKSLLSLKPQGIDLPWTSQNYLSALTHLQLQSEHLEKSPELFKTVWRNEILENGSLSESNLIKSLEKSNLIDIFEIYRTPTVDIDLFPFYSVFLQFTFKLAKPYISKDDEEFYICDNPVKKDKVFKVPIVSGSTWKGNMRWTAGRLLEMDTDENERFNKRIQISNLFGNENESEKRYFDTLMPGKKEAFDKQMKCLFGKEGIRRGRLNFYPTFFDQISLEVINPHDRKTKAGTLPIYIESVPEGASGTFSLLYVPFDLIGRLPGEIKRQVDDDMTLVYNSLREMMLTYGFSAKKSSGFGVIDKDLKKGIFRMSGYPYKKNLLAPEPTKKRMFSSFTELLSSNQTTNQANNSMFSSFSEMWGLIEQVKAEVVKNAG